MSELLEQQPVTIDSRILAGPALDVAFNEITASLMSQPDEPEEKREGSNNGGQTNFAEETITMHSPDGEGEGSGGDPWGTSGEGGDGDDREGNSDSRTN